MGDTDAQQQYALVKSKVMSDSNQQRMTQTDEALLLTQIKDYHTTDLEVMRKPLKIVITVRAKLLGWSDEQIDDCLDIKCD